MDLVFFSEKKKGLRKDNAAQEALVTQYYAQIIGL